MLCLQLCPCLYSTSTRLVKLNLEGLWPPPAFNCHRQHHWLMIRWGLARRWPGLVWLRTRVRNKDSHYRTLFSVRASGSSLPDNGNLHKKNRGSSQPKGWGLRTQPGTNTATAWPSYPGRLCFLGLGVCRVLGGPPLWLFLKFLQLIPLSVTHSQQLTVQISFLFPVSLLLVSSSAKPVLRDMGQARGPSPLCAPPLLRGSSPPDSGL